MADGDIDEFTKTILQRTRERRLKLEAMDSPKRVHPRADDENESPKRSCIENSSVTSVKTHCSTFSTVIIPVAAATEDSENVGVETPRTTRKRFAALADKISNWEDDLSHPVVKKDETPKKTWQPLKVVSDNSPAPPIRSQSSYTAVLNLSNTAVSSPSILKTPSKSNIGEKSPPKAVSFTPSVDRTWEKSPSKCSITQKSPPKATTTPLVNSAREYTNSTSPSRSPVRKSPKGEVTTAPAPPVAKKINFWEDLCQESKKEDTPRRIQLPPNRLVTLTELPAKPPRFEPSAQKQVTGPPSLSSVCNNVTIPPAPPLPSTSTWKSPNKTSASQKTPVKLGSTVPGKPPMDPRREEKRNVLRADYEQKLQEMGFAVDPSQHKASLDLAPFKSKTPEKSSPKPPVLKVEERKVTRITFDENQKVYTRTKLKGPAYNDENAPLSPYTGPAGNRSPGKVVNSVSKVSPVKPTATSGTAGSTPKSIYSLIRQGPPTNTSTLSSSSKVSSSNLSRKRKDSFSDEDEEEDETTQNQPESENDETQSDDETYQEEYSLESEQDEQECEQQEYSYESEEFDDEPNQHQDIMRTNAPKASFRKARPMSQPPCQPDDYYSSIGNRNSAPSQPAHKFAPNDVLAHSTDTEEERQLPMSLDSYRSSVGKLRNAPVPKKTIVRNVDPVKYHMDQKPQKPNISPEIIIHRIKELQEQVTKDQTAIGQISRAMDQCCGPDSAFAGSQEAVECHKQLMIACKRREANICEIQHLQQIQRDGKMDDMNKHNGSLTISDIRLPLKQDFVQQIAGPHDATTHYFIVILRHKNHIVFTQMVSTHDSLVRGTLEFPNLVKFTEIREDFQVQLEVHGMSVTRDITKQTPKKKAFLTPKKKKLGSQYLQSPGGPTAVRSTNFVLVAHMRLNYSALGKTHFNLERVPYSSPLQGTIFLRMQCLIESNVEESGFLTMFEDVSGFGAWHRRWFVLQNNCLMYWKYPDEERVKEPMGAIDLKTVITDNVGLIPRDICARPNTFELISVRRQTRGDTDTLVSRCYDTMTTTKFWLSCDTKEDRMIWCSKLNESLENVRTWHKDALRPINRREMVASCNPYCTSTSTNSQSEELVLPFVPHTRQSAL